MLSFRKKILVIGVVCLIPSYVMGGSCYGQKNKNSVTVSCQGKQKQLGLTPITKEIFSLSSEMFDEILRGSDTLEEIKIKLALLDEAGAILKQNNMLLKENNRNIKSLRNQLHKQNISKTEQRELRRRLSVEKQNFARLKEKNSNQLYKLEQRLNSTQNQNHNLSSFIESTANVFSSNLASSFSHYKKCASSNAVLSRFTIPAIQRERQQKDSFSSGGASLNYSQIFSTLSSSGISSYSLESCADEFESLKNRFTLYEVTLNLLVSSDSRRRAITQSFFKEYRGRDASGSDISSFLRAFETYPKNHGLGSLIQNVNAYMQSY